MELDAILDNLSDEEQIELLELLEEEENYRNTHLLYEFTPYSKQREFIDAGHDYPERCFMAGNQLGKSFTGAAESRFTLPGVIRAQKAILLMVNMAVSGKVSVFMILLSFGLVARQTRL